MTFNIMHDKYTNKEKYPHCNKEYLNYEYRIKIIRDIIISKNVDIIVLQEADSLKLDDFKFEDFILFYQNDKARQKKLDKYQAGEISTIHSLINIILINKKLFNTHYMDIDIEFKSYSRYISCKFNYNGILLEITNVHLDLNDEENRLKHLNKIIKFHNNDDNDNNHAHIIIGDFNDIVDNLDKILVNYENVYKTHGFPKFTYKGYDRGDFNEFVIDHLYHTKNIICNNYEISNESVLPSDKYPSDHLYIIFEIEIDVDIINN